jgi:hypothetical protein
MGAKVYQNLYKFSLFCQHYRCACFQAKDVNSQPITTPKEHTKRKIMEETDSCGLEENCATESVHDLGSSPYGTP